jgi:hypothetical protein
VTAYGLQVVRNGEMRSACHFNDDGVDTLLVEINDRDTRTSCCERKTDLTSNAARASGDDYATSFEAGANLECHPRS